METKKEIHIDLEDNKASETGFEMKADDIQEEDGELIVNGENAEAIIETGKGVFKLHKPITFDGKETDSIYFDLSAVSPLRYMSIVKEVEKKERAPLTQPAHDLNVDIKLFSLASGVPTTILTSGLSLKDFNTICTLVYAFLVG